jgi:flagellar basal body-associated protein FliL
MSSGLGVKEMTKKRSKRVKKKKNRLMYIIVGLVIGIFIFTAGTMAMMVKDEMEEEVGPPPEPVKEAHLFVEDVFFMKTGSRADGEDIDMLTTVYVTNDGLADALNVKITARSMDDKKNLVHDKVDKTVGNIPIQKTSEIELIIKIPTGSRHEVDLMIFEKGLLILRGTGSVAIEGSPSSTPKYQTEELRGTINDSDYDGMQDDWELYYGLNPNDPSDAFKDADGDGKNNLQEYKSDTAPCKPKKKSAGAGGADSLLSEESGDALSIIGLVVLIVIIIIIVIIVIAVSKPSNSKWQKYYNAPSHTQQPWSNKFETVGTSTPSQNQTQTNPKHCMNCGGWIVNEACVSCGWRVPSNILSKPPSGKVVDKEN